MTTVFRRVRGKTAGASGALSDGVRRMAEAFGCRSAFGYLLGRDGRLRLKEAVPSAGAAPATLCPDDARPLFDALYADGPERIDSAACAKIPREGSCCLAIPLAGREGPSGVVLATFDRELRNRDLAALAFAGNAIAFEIEAARRTELLERRLHASERVSKRLVSGVIASGAACFILDLDGRVVRWSPGARERFGWRDHDVRGRRLPSPESAADRMTLDLRTGAASEEPFPLEIEVALPDGSAELVRGVAVAIAGEEESATAVLVVCEGSDEDETGASSLRQAYLAALVERELASPLTAIKGYAELLSRSSIAEDPAQRNRVAKALTDRAREIERLLKDLAVLSGLERASGLIVEAVDLREIVTEAAERVNREHGARVLAVDEGGDGGSVLVDRLCASHAFEGLLRCVVRTVSHDDVVRVSVRTEQRSAIVTLEPPASALDERDDGLGRRSATSARAFTEAGVGFHLARLTAEAHGGLLRLEPAASAIPRIEMRLPLHEGPEEAAWLVPIM